MVKGGTKDIDSQAFQFIPYRPMIFGVNCSLPFEVARVRHNLLLSCSRKPRAVI